MAEEIRHYIIYDKTGKIVDERKADKFVAECLAKHYQGRFEQVDRRTTERARKRLGPVRELDPRGLVIQM